MVQSLAQLIASSPTRALRRPSSRSTASLALAPLRRSRREINYLRIRKCNMSGSSARAISTLTSALCAKAS